MLTKSELNNPPILNWGIKKEKDLDLCIEALSNNEITNCALHFTSNTLPDKKIIKLQQSLKSQKLTILSLTADLLVGSAENIATHLGSVFESLKDSLVSLTFRGLFADNTSLFLADLIKKTSSLTLLSVGAYFHGQTYYGIQVKTLNPIAEALRTNETLSTLDLHSNMLLPEGALIIANALTGNKLLQKIDLRDNFIFPTEETYLLELLKSNQNLTEILLVKTLIRPLKFERTIYSQQDFEQVLEYLTKSKNLSHIKLELWEVNNRLFDDLTVQLMVIIMELEHLQSLQLFGFSNDYFVGLSEIVRFHPTLEHFTFRMNDGLTINSTQNLATLIESNSKLRSISIGSMKSQYFPMIPSSLLFKALEQNTSLTHVDLSNNFIDDEKKATDNIVAMLKINKSLKSLKLTNLFRNDNKAVQTILSALAENQTLLNLHLDNNSSYVNKPVISELEKNTSLIYLHLLNHPDLELMDMDDFNEFLFENDIPSKTLVRIEQIIKRNIDLKLCSLYQNYLLLTKFTLPADVQKSIFNLLIAKFGIEEIIELSTTSSLKNGDYLDPPVAQEIEDNKIDNFKTIYKALYEGQSSFFKRWNSLVEKVDLTDLDIEQYIKEKPDSRTAKAWQLADNYTIEEDYRKLFKEVHQYSFANSSNFFGLFKQTHNFSERYGFKDQPEQGSRTKTIADIFEANSIKPG
jgi:hypothetical protein